MLGFWLAKALGRCAGVRLLAVCQMTNHLHLVIEDTLGEVSAFMQYFVGHAAKSLNKLDGVRGGVFERRFAEITILDHDALAQRVAYAINNPVEANLVRTHQAWTGLCMFASAQARTETFTRLREREYDRAREEAARCGGRVNEADYLERVELVLPALDRELAARVAGVVEDRGKDLRRGQVTVRGVARVRAVSPFGRPRMSSRSAMPLCFASTREVRDRFLEGWRAFVAAYRLASEALRAGMLDVAFPPWSHRPSTPCGAE